MQQLVANFFLEGEMFFGIFRKLTGDHRRKQGLPCGKV